MANIRVDVDYTIMDGSEVVFRSPVDCSQITGLKVYYIGSSGSAASKEFTLADAHGNNVGVIDHLFAEDVVVKVILDVTKGMAFVQNADTNAYLEARLGELAPINIVPYFQGEIDRTRSDLGYQTDILAAHVNNLNNPHGISIHSIGAAPDGYGLGRAQSITGENIDDICAPGWYHKDFGKKIDVGGASFRYCYLHVSGYGDSSLHCRQELYPVESGSGCKLVRIKLNGTWQEWEWENPPMIPGEEYRTTERHNENVVYTKAISIEALPNATSANYSTGVHAPKIFRESHVIHTSTGYTVKSPYFSVAGALLIKHLFTGSNLQIATTSDYSGATAEFQIWYEKD